MNTKHTPGPWTIRGNQHKTTKTVSRRNEDGTFDEVCSVPGAFTGEEIMLANARLIAAAPDLLAALKMLNAQGALQSDDSSLRPYFEQAFKAIAKAEGKEP